MTSGRARIVVAGAGAVGSVVGGMLSAHGHDVLLVGRDPHMAAIARDGLRVTGLFGEHRGRPRVATDLADADEPADVVPPRRGCRVLVLSPTRELASQIAESFKTYGKHLGFSVALIYGGVKYGPQVRALAGGVDILVATPGRLIDHLQEDRHDEYDFRQRVT